MVTIQIRPYTEPVNLEQMTSEWSDWISYRMDKYPRHYIPEFPDFETAKKFAAENGESNWEYRFVKLDKGSEWISKRSWTMLLEDVSDTI